MTITATSTFTVADQAPTTVSAPTIVQPPVAFNAGGRGRIVHPTLGSYDYATAPDEVENFNGDVLVAPIWTHAMTLAGGVDTLWPGYMRDGKVVERWAHGDGSVGGPMSHLSQMWQFFANPPDPVTGTPVVWAPNYATAREYNVILSDLRVGGQSVKLNLRLARMGYTPASIEVEYRILGYAN